MAHKHQKRVLKNSCADTARETGTNFSPLEEMVPPHALRAASRNARTHSKKQIGQIAASIQRFGFVSPVIVDHRNRIVCGHARVEAAKTLNLARVPIKRISPHLSEAEVRAFALADNKLAEKAGWDPALLAAEFEDLALALPELGLDLSTTAFEPHEIDSILADLGESTTLSAGDSIPDPQDTVVARKGDVFVLDQHRITAGDARDGNAFQRLMMSETATMVFVDPPYNVRIQGHVGGRGRIKHREFEYASGEMTSQQFTRFLQDSLTQCARHTIDGGITYVCMDWRHISELLAAGAAVYDELKNICVWNKTTPGQGSFYRSQYELVFVYKRGKGPHLNTFELGQNGRTRSNVWSYPGANAFRAGRMDELKMHPTVKPVALIADVMRDCSRRGSIILDAFAGAGTTIIAAEQIGRRAFCIEIDPRYVDVAVRRWQQATGKDAILEATGQTFEEALASPRR
jgi:DNA modification methylase